MNIFDTNIYSGVEYKFAIEEETNGTVTCGMYPHINISL